MLMPVLFIFLLSLSLSVSSHSSLAVDAWFSRIPARSWEKWAAFQLLVRWHRKLLFFTENISGKPKLWLEKSAFIHAVSEDYYVFFSVKKRSKKTASQQLWGAFDVCVCVFFKCCFGCFKNCDGFATKTLFMHANIAQTAKQSKDCFGAEFCR